MKIAAAKMSKMDAYIPVVDKSSSRTIEVFLDNVVGKAYIDKPTTRDNNARKEVRL